MTTFSFTHNYCKNKNLFKTSFNSFYARKSCFSSLKPHFSFVVLTLFSCIFESGNAPEEKKSFPPHPIHTYTYLLVHIYPNGQESCPCFRSHSPGKEKQTVSFLERKRKKLLVANPLPKEKMSFALHPLFCFDVMGKSVYSFLYFIELHTNMKEITIYDSSLAKHTNDYFISLNS